MWHKKEWQDYDKMVTVLFVLYGGLFGLGAELGWWTFVPFAVMFAYAIGFVRYADEACPLGIIEDVLVIICGAPCALVLALAGTGVFAFLANTGTATTLSTVTTVLFAVVALAVVVLMAIPAFTLRSARSIASSAAYGDR